MAVGVDDPFEHLALTAANGLRRAEKSAVGARVVSVGGLFRVVQGGAQTDFVRSELARIGTNEFGIPAARRKSHQ